MFADYSSTTAIFEIHTLLWASTSVCTTINHADAGDTQNAAVQACCVFHFISNSRGQKRNTEIRYIPTFSSLDKLVFWNAL